MLRMIRGVVHLILAITLAVWLRSPSAADADISGISCKPSDPGDSAQSMNSLSERQAIDRAEAFVMANGYTSLPGNPDSFQGESIEISTQVSEIFAWRHNTLKPRAYGAIPMPAPNAGWTVVFEYRIPFDPEAGRAVTMDACGEGMRMQHQDFSLAKVR